MKAERSVIDSITQNENSKIAYDYAIMLCNNKFEHMVYYFKEMLLFKAYNAGKNLKTRTNRKKTLTKNYCAKI